MSEPAGPPTTPVRRRDYTSSVYGSVLAASVAVGSGDSRGPVVLAILLLVTGMVFWFAHVYAATVASVHGGWHVGAIRIGMHHEWPLAFASVPPAIAALVVGLVAGHQFGDGAWAAVIVAVLELQFWGLAAVRSAGLTGRALTRTLTLNMLMGLVIIVLKLALPAH